VKPSYGLTLAYFTGKAGKTGFGSSSTAEQVTPSDNFTVPFALVAATTPDTLAVSTEPALHCPGQVSAKWNGKDQVALVTGAAAGLGYESARVLALRGAHVVVAVRSQVRQARDACELRNPISPAGGLARLPLEKILLERYSPLSPSPPILLCLP
jgi:hypothetical protein